jgi:hypothetical protein
VVALLASRGSDGDRSASISERQVGASATTAPGESERIAPLRFILGDRHAVGETIDVVIENVGPGAYVFQSFYQACFLSYFDSSGRRFIIPPGTHCDLLTRETIRSGERKKLFRWSLDECVRDQWGCVKSRLLPPGTYTIKGVSSPKLGGRQLGPRRHSQSSRPRPSNHRPPPCSGPRLLRTSARATRRMAQWTRVRGRRRAEGSPHARGGHEGDDSRHRTRKEVPERGGHPAYGRRQGSSRETGSGSTRAAAPE